MRETFRKELERLDQDVIRMGALVEAAIEEATQALAEGDVARAEKVMLGDDDIDRFFIDVEKRCMALLAQQQPVASDLRLILIILKVVHDLERAGDLAFNIAEMVREEDVKITRLKPLSGLIYNMGQASRKILSKTLDAWAAKDLEAAAKMSSLDDEVDQLYQKLVKELLALQKETSYDLALNLVVVGRHFERIADHAVNMAEGIRYYITGNEEYLG